MIRTIAAATLLGITTSSALAQSVPTAAAATPDPARLAAADTLLETLMPPARRRALLTQMMTAMTKNVIDGLHNDPALSKLFDNDRRVQLIFERFIAARQGETLALMNENLPGMVSAMTRAYARRFTVAQMGEMKTFFATPTGQLYMDQGATILSDPDVAAWQQRLIQVSMGKISDQTRAMVAEIAALSPPPKTQ